MKILIKNGRILDPASNTDTNADLLVEDGIITKLDKKIKSKSAKTIDAAGCWVVPGLIDMHVHLRDPGYCRKETIATGTRSAALGGFTSICPMANTDPVTDNEVVVEYIHSKAKKNGVVNVLPVGSITKGMKGEELSAIMEMSDAGICALSDDGKYVENAAILRNAMICAKMYGLPILSHCEDPNITGKGQINAGRRAEALGLKGIPAYSEEIAVARDIILAKATGVSLHICHVSAKNSLSHIRAAKQEGTSVTAEVCPHHFSLCDEDIIRPDANYKMSPPLRGKQDVEALKEALADGTIDVIATDHAPHHEDEKSGKFEDAPNGIAGFETAVALCISELVLPGILSPLDLIAKMTVNPAKILRSDKGRLSVGACADIAIINPDAKYTIDKNKFASLSRNTPFHGRKVTGKVMYTIVAGEIIVSEGELKC